MTPPKASDQVRCPRGHLTSGKFPFCTECGAELNPQEASDGAVRCPNGHLVTGGHRFCIECGAPVEVPDDVADETPGEAPDEASATPLADTEDDDVPEADEVRCPKGHLTPGEYPYCIICGAELEKGAAAAAPAAAPAPPAKPAPRARRTVRRRPRAPVADEPADEPDEPDATEEVVAPTRRAPRVRRPVRQPVPADEPEDEDEDDFLVEDVPPIVTMDEPDEDEEVADDEPFLAPVPSYSASDQRDESVEHFVHTPSAGQRVRAPRPGFDKQKWVIPVAAGVLAVIAAVVLVLILRKPGTPTAVQTPLPTAVVTNAPASVAPTAKPQPTVAAGPNANVPMLVSSPTVRPTASSGSYVASATIRNPTDFTAKNITVTFTLKDQSGAVIGTVNRTIAALAPGGNIVVSESGTDPGGKQPTSVDAHAVAAQITR